MTTESKVAMDSIRGSATDFANSVYKVGYDQGRKDVEEQCKEAYERGLNVAWGYAKKITNDMPAEDFDNIFGYQLKDHIFRALSASEAIIKIKDHEEEQKSAPCSRCQHRHSSFDCHNFCVPYGFDRFKEIKFESQVFIGDEIESTATSTKAAVVYISSWGAWECICERGTFSIELDKQQYWKKTGRSFPEIHKMLDELRGNCN